MIAPPYHFGSDRWPGLAKLIEESAEVGQVLGKLIATGGHPKHWDGSDLREDLTLELGDLLAAITFLVQHNLLDNDVVMGRAEAKLALFEQWHEEQSQSEIEALRQVFGGDEVDMGDILDLERDARV